MKKSYTTDLTQGNTVLQLLRFAIPFVLSSLIQQLYNMADLVVVGQFAGKISLAGVNVSAAFLLFMTNVSVGFSLGGSVLVGQYAGAKDENSVRKTIGNLFILLACVALIITACLLIFGNPLLDLLQTPAEARSEAFRYMIICALGTLFIYGYNGISAVLRGLGDSKRPFLAVVITCVINVVLDLVLVGVFHMGAAGAAIATVVSQGISMFICIGLLVKSDFVFDFKPSSFRPDKEMLLRILKVSAPSAIQNGVISFSFMFQTAVASSLGVTAVAAVGSAGKIGSLGVTPSVAIGNATSAMVAQNIGAKQEDRAVHTMYSGMGLNFAFNLLIFTVIQLFCGKILLIFGSDPELISSGVRYLRFYLWDLLLIPFMGNFCGLFNGSGHTKVSSVLNVLSSVVVRIPVCFLFGIVLGLGVAGVGMGAPASNVASTLLSFLYYKKGGWKKPVVK